MQLGMVGLWRMGGNMVRRLQKGGHECVGYAPDKAAVAALEKEGMGPAHALAELRDKLKPPRAVWLMVPAGKPTEDCVAELKGLLQAGDVILDGGNSFFKDDIRRAADLAPRGVHYVDVGTSGGVWGLERGYCLMIGGEEAVVKRLQPIFETLAPGRGDVGPTPGRDTRAKPGATADRGFLHCGPVGSGHFVKMIHNGIEYGLMQAYAEGLDILKDAGQESNPGYRYQLDLGEITELWRRGSVVGSWLLDLTAQALVEDPQLAAYSGNVSDSGEGRWTVQTAVEQATPAEVLTSSLYTRFRSRREHTFAEKVLSAMRHKFGGHVEVKK